MVYHFNYLRMKVLGVFSKTVALERKLRSGMWIDLQDRIGLFEWIWGIKKDG